MEEATTLAQSGPDDYAIWGNLGDAYLFSGAPSAKSRTAYLRAIELAERTDAAAPADQAVLSSVLAEYFAKIGDVARAREQIASALEDAPENATVRYEAGIAYAMLDEDDRSFEELKAALVRGYPMERLRTAPELQKIRRRSDFARLLEYARTSP